MYDTLNFCCSYVYDLFTDLFFLLILREYEGRGLETDALQFKHVVMQALTEVFGQVSTVGINTLSCSPLQFTEVFRQVGAIGQNKHDVMQAVTEVFRQGAENKHVVIQAMTKWFRQEAENKHAVTQAMTEVFRQVAKDRVNMLSCKP